MAVLCYQTGNHNGTKSSTAGTTFTFTAGATAKAGDTHLVLVVIPSATVSVSGIADNAAGGSNSYSQITSTVNGAMTVELWKSTFTTGGNITITVTLSATGTLAVGLDAGFRNVSSIGAASLVTGSTSPITTGVQNLAQQGNSFLILGGGVAGVTTFTNPVGTILTQQNVTGASGVFMSSLPDTVNPVTDSAVLGTPTTWSGLIVEVDGFVAPAEGTKIQRNWSQDKDSGNGISATTLSITATGAQSVTQGDLIVAIWRTTQSGATVTISDNKNAGNYTNAYRQDEGANGTGEIGCYFMPNSVAAAAGQLIVTVTTSISALIYLGVLVYHGAHANPFDGAISFEYAPTQIQNPTSGQVTPTVSGDLAVGTFSLPSSATITLTQEALGFTSELSDDIGTATFAHCHSGDRLTPDSSTVEYLVTLSTGGALATPMMGLALFKPLATPGSAPISGGPSVMMGTMQRRPVSDFIA